MSAGATGPNSPRRGRAALLLATASLLVILGRMHPAQAQSCQGANDAPPADVATPAALYETLRARTDAQLLAIGFGQKPVASACAWIYEVKVLTKSGAVVELDFAARDLGLIGVRGPDNDREVARLVRGLGGDIGTLITGSTDSDRQTSGKAGSGSSGGGGGGHSGPGGGGEGGEGGNSGSGSGGSGGGSSGSGGGEGGEGGNSGSGGGEGGGGEGGEGGGDD